MGTMQKGGGAVMKSVTFDILDVCDSQYFQGHRCKDNEVLVAISAHPGHKRSLKSFVEDVLQDINNTDPGDAFEGITDDMIRKAVRDSIGTSDIKHLYRYIE